MPLEAPLAPVAERALHLNRRYRHHGAVAVLERALSDPQVGRIALVSSFGAESVVLLHMVSRFDRSLPVIFLDTEMLFPETLRYQRDLAQKLGLTSLQIEHPGAAATERDPLRTLHQTDPDACCDIRKTIPLRAALTPFDAWITGRKRYQGGQRTTLEFFEAEDNAHRLKVNPLAHWTRGDIEDYIVNNRLPRHPLVAKGFPSIGCMPCTSAVAPGEDLRAGRWRGTAKSECGIHIANGQVVRGPNTGVHP